MIYARHMKTVRSRTTSVLVVLMCVVGLAGCSSGPAPEWKVLDAVAGTLDLESISEVVCVTHWSPPPLFTSGVSHSRTAFLEGPSHIDEAVAELAANGFERDADLGGAALVYLDGPEGVRASVSSVAPPNGRLGETFTEQGDTGDCTFPVEGYTEVGLSLPS